jgi:hypothetical protein
MATGIGLHGLPGEAHGAVGQPGEEHGAESDNLARRTEQSRTGLDAHGPRMLHEDKYGLCKDSGVEQHLK